MKSKRTRHELNYLDKSMKSQFRFIININLHWLKGIDIRVKCISKPSSGNDFHYRIEDG